MRYWSFFAAKMAAIGGVLWAVWRIFHAVWHEPDTFNGVRLNPFATDLGYTFAAMAFCLLATGLVYLAVLDQRYRCRTCLRRLRMPVSHGSWNQLLMGRPRTEYICPFGHGTLRVPEMHLASPEVIDWRPIDDMWKELYELEETRK